MIVILAGLPGSGKTTLARELAVRLNGAVLNKDSIRAALFEPSHVAYSAEQDDFCQDVMLDAATYLLEREPQLHVFLDGRTFSREYQRRRVMDRCEKRGWRWVVIECVCTEEVAIRRLEESLASKSHPAANRTPDLYRKVRANWEPIDTPKLVVDTGGDLDSCVAAALAYLAEAASR